jgi:hypothetical protein
VGRILARSLTKRSLLRDAQLQEKGEQEGAK